MKRVLARGLFSSEFKGSHFVCDHCRSFLKRPTPGLWVAATLVTRGIARRWESRTGMADVLQNAALLFQDDILPFAESSVGQT